MDLVLIKRQQKGIDALANIGMALWYKTDVQELATDWESLGVMTADQFTLAQEEFKFSMEQA